MEFAFFTLRFAVEALIRSFVDSLKRHERGQLRFTSRALLLRPPTTVFFKRGTPDR